MNADNDSATKSQNSQYRTFGQNDQWTISRGPIIEKSFFSLDAFSTRYDVVVTIFPTDQGCSSHRPGQKIVKLMIHIPRDHARLFGTLSIPTLRKKIGFDWHQVAWEEGLAEIVAAAIEAWEGKTSECGDALALIAERIRGEKKQLQLKEGVALQGNLWHINSSKGLHQSVEILGNVCQRNIVREDVLCTFRIPRTEYPPDEKNPPVELAQLHEQWCPRLAELVLEYIEVLARYADEERIKEHLMTLIKKGESSSQWRKTVRKIQQNLVRVPEEQQPQLIEELRSLGTRLKINIV